ncbi:MAG TPA: ankyrin repeat domain-containing protein [Stenomitos sp.]
MASTTPYYELLEACRTGDSMLLKQLLQRGCRPNLHPQNSKVHSFESPLFCAVEANSLECVRLLLEAGVDVNVADCHNYTPLMLIKTAEIAEVLINAGADIHATGSFGDDVLSEIFSNTCHHDFDDSERISVEDLCKIVCLMRDAGINLNTQSERNGWTYLYNAAFSIQPEAVEALLRFGADPKIGISPVNGACWQSNCYGYDHKIARVIDLLIEAGTEVDLRDAGGATLLHCAAQEYNHSADYNHSSDGCNYTAIVTLLKHGADPDPVDADGNTPLMNAAFAGHPESVQALIEAGANPSHRNHKGETAIDWVAEPYQYLQSTCNRLKNISDSSSNRELVFYSEQLQNLNKIMLLLKAGLDCSHPN